MKCGKKKRYVPKSSLRSKGFLVPKNFSDEDDERDIEIGQPGEQNEGKQ